MVFGDLEAEGVIMNDQTDMYLAQMVPLIKQLQAIATEYSIPLMVVTQVSSGDFELSLNVPKHAHWNSSPLANFIATPTPLKVITISSVQRRAEV